MARRFWPGEEAVGKRIALGRVTTPERLIQVIGVVKDVRQFELNADPKQMMYLTHRQAVFFPPRDLVVKTDVDPASMAATVRKAVWEIDKDQPVSNIRTMDEILADSIARQRFSMLLLAIFAAVAAREVAVESMQLIAHLLGALREGDYSIRGPSTRSGSATASVMREVNDLGSTLQRQRTEALESAALLTHVMEEIAVAVFAFDPSNALLLVNKAGAGLLGPRATPWIGVPAAEIGFDDYLTGDARRLIEPVQA